MVGQLRSALFRSSAFYLSFFLVLNMVLKLHGVDLTLTKACHSSEKNLFALIVFHLEIGSRSPQGKHNREEHKRIQQSKDDDDEPELEEDHEEVRLLQRSQNKDHYQSCNATVKHT